MGLLVLLLGCGPGVLATPDGREPLRGALWFRDRGVASAAVVPHRHLVLLTNSPLNCWPELLEDDPDTAEDEAASALLYWQGEIAAAFTREDARAVVLALYSRSSRLDGEYALTEDGLRDPTTALSADERAGFGAWLHVIEASVDELDGLFYAYTPVEVAYNRAVQAPASADVRRDDDRITGEFAFTNDHWSGRFEAGSCDNDDLFNQVLQLVYTFGSVVETD